MSKVVRMRIANFGYIGPARIEVLLATIVCFGWNNTGKCTVFRTDEAAVTSADTTSSTRAAVHIRGNEPVPSVFSVSRSEFASGRSRTCQQMRPSHSRTESVRIADVSTAPIGA